jgi:mannosyltransferase
MIGESLAEAVQTMRRYLRRRYQVPLVLASCTIVGLVLRIAMARRGGIWCDEAQLLWIVRIPTFDGMIDFLWHHESHPPLFYLLMRVWLDLFGDSETSALALPVVLGVALIPAAYLVGDRVFSQRAGLIAATFVTVSPRLAGYSGMVRPYSLLPLLCLFSAYWLWVALRGGGARPWVLYVLATLAMLLTHNWAWMVLAAQWTLIACWCAMHIGRTNWALVRFCVIAQIALLAAYSPWIPFLVYQFRHAGYNAFPVDPFGIVANLAETVVSLPTTAAVPVLALLIVAAAWHAARRSWAVLPREDDLRLSLLLFVGIPLLAFGAATVLSFKTFLLIDRCLITIIPCVLVSVAYGVASYSSMPRVVTSVFASIYLLFSLNDLRDIKSNSREAAAIVAAMSRPTDLVVITPVWFASSFNYYYTRDSAQDNYPHAERRGAIDYDNLRARVIDPGPIAAARRRLVEAHRERRRVWFVTEPRISNDDVSDCNRLPVTLEFPSFAQVCHVRASQLRKQLNTLFGPPNTLAVPIGGRSALEDFSVSLYAREDQ